MFLPPVEIETSLRHGLQLVGGMYATEPGLPELEGVGRRKSPKLRFVQRNVASICRGRRGVEAVVRIDGRFNPKSVNARKLPRKQLWGLPASGHSVFLDEAEPTLDHAVVTRPIYARVLMADRCIPADRGEHLFRDLRAVLRSDAFDSDPDVGRNFIIAAATSTTHLVLRR